MVVVGDPSYDCAWAGAALATPIDNEAIQLHSTPLWLRARMPEGLRVYTTRSSDQHNFADVLGPRRA
jgi:hypothetical protein